jgi:hypothetical protein
MKKINVFYLLAVLFVACIVVSCETEDDLGNGDDSNSIENMSLIAFYEPDDLYAMGDQKQLAKLEVDNGELSFSSFESVYPEGDNFYKNADLSGDFLALALHNDFDDGYSSLGVCINIATKDIFNLPLVAPQQDSDYAYFQSGTARVSENGYVVYSSATNDKHYGDEYRPYLIRYNTQTNEYQLAISPENFVLSQPEKGSDTETGQFNRTLYISPDGRYVYGVLEAYGVSGNIHWDYDILYQYDFENEEYMRLGEEGDDDVSIVGLTADGKKVVYMNDGETKIHDISTGLVTQRDLYFGGSSIPKQWNNDGLCRSATTGIYYDDFVNDAEIKVLNEYGTGNVFFSENGQNIYFTMDGSETNYFCRTQGLLENSLYDTICALPKEFVDVFVLE